VNMKKIMKHFGYFITESPFHLSEYLPYFRKNKETIKKLRVDRRWWLTHEQSSDEYFEVLEKQLASSKPIEIEKTYEYGPDIIHALETNIPFRANLNVPNTGLISNLPYRCCVEVPCFIDAMGIHPCYVGDLPEQLAGLNQTNINIQKLMVEAALEKDLEKKKEHAKHAIMLDPLTSALLDLDQISNMVDEMFEANKKFF